MKKLLMKLKRFQIINLTIINEEIRIQEALEKQDALYLNPIDANTKREIMIRQLNLKVYIENIEDRIQKINEIVFEKVKGEKSFNFVDKLINKDMQKILWKNINYTLEKILIQTLIFYLDLSI